MKLVLIGLGLLATTTVVYAACVFCAEGARQGAQRPRESRGRARCGAIEYGSVARACARPGSALGETAEIWHIGHPLLRFGARNSARAGARGGEHGRRRAMGRAVKHCGGSPVEEGLQDSLGFSLDVIPKHATGG
jgi:hypothetical protein